MTNPVNQAFVRAHIVALRVGGEVVSYQLRVGDGGPGRSKNFAVRKLGGLAKAMRAAKAFAKENGLTLGIPRGGSPLGRRTKRSPTPAAGIRFEWVEFPVSTVLYVVASWADKNGKPCRSAASTARHGLEGALDMAIAKRVSCGAPEPDRKALLKALRAEYASKA